ncbi:MAG TPA: hypothetical protein PKW50_03515 [Syntrophomonas sp.]|nr:hypothetical protein [Syntrophomonas sp.]
MRDVLQHWQDLPREDLFSFWRDEVQLKKELRQDLSGYRELKIQSKSQYVFLRQSLAYGEYKPVFMQILFLNMDSPTVQNELLQGPIQLCGEFLRCLPQTITAENPSPQSLQFLINLYRDEFKNFYEDILAVLGYEACDYLLERTANNNLRKMLKSRCTQLHQQQSEIHHGLLQSTPGNHPTIFGDKIDLLKQTVRLLTFTPETSPENLFISLTKYLEAAEQLYLLGLLNECLALLQIVYNQWISDKENFLPEDYNYMNKSISRILSKSLSIYALINSSSPYQYSQNLYRQYFTDLRAENNARIYLQIYQALHTNRDGNMNYTFIEMRHLFLQLDQGEDDLLADYFINDAEFNENTWCQLLAEIDRDLTVMPHRALTTMEILRFLVYSHKIIMSKALAGKLLQDYLALYKWIPAAPFLNRDILDQLGKSADYDLQSEADKQWSATSKYTRQSIQALYLTHPDRFKDGSNIVLQQMLLGSFLGVNK